MKDSEQKSRLKKDSKNSQSKGRLTMNKLTRRDFIKSTAAVGAAMALPFSKARGANDDIRVGVAGIRGRGDGLANEFNDLKGARLVALCDVDSEVLDKRVKQFKDRNETVTGYVDYRRML